MLSPLVLQLKDLNTCKVRVETCLFFGGKNRCFVLFVFKILNEIRRWINWFGVLKYFAIWKNQIWINRLGMMNYLIVGGIDNNLLPIKSDLFIDSVVVVLYDPELLSWYSGSMVTAAGISVLDKSFFFNEFVLTFDCWFTWNLRLRTETISRKSNGSNSYGNVKQQ